MLHSRTTSIKQLSIAMIGWMLALYTSISLASTESAPMAPKASNNSEATLTILNREIIHFRTTVLGIEPEERVKRAQRRIEQQLSNTGEHKLSMTDMPPGKLIQIDGAGSFYIAPEDADPFQQESLDSVAKQTLERLNLVLKESRESRSLEGMLRAGAYVAIASLLFATLLWLTFRLRRAVVVKTLSFARDKLDGHELIESKLINREHIQSGLRRVLQWFSWLVIFLLTYEWLSYSLSQFPFTRPLGEQLNHYLLNLVGKIGSATIKAIPDLFTAIVIFFLAKIVTHGLNSLFDRIENGNLEVTWLAADVVSPTRRIVKVAIWLFALTMAYPYLPGSGTEAFKGISVLLGLMISLGASSLIAQAASGLILTYSRIYRQGEFIHVNGHEGTITDLGMFTTRIRNGMGLEITLPNALVLGNVTKNYSRALQGPGFVIDTKVTIGYDTPWRQVEAMLIEAARRTPSILQDPTPKVFQTALSDFYPEYLLICQAAPADPVPRAEVMSLLHANIQDVFNEYNVQIMSPHYLGDPEKEKLVPKEGWFRAPANQKQTTNDGQEQNSI
ncbi:mechanosensitive ion channel family protein [Undibacterium macrobrachii]|uniref:Small-conductance mechanosensitive channel n=1 Tax=Undibacterium macrobrachii TaxID=1119058 RepID=A0ABQ2XAZ1_9BURK|nr:mechanosensitive ion channel domain-containing protein [Undibacterium macrobrachii]GGX08256.1 mechanosensitive ion channel protein MscS [Undibacterium macrobrachii]